MFMVVSAVAMPFVGRLVDRWSLRGTIAIGAGIGAAGLAMMGPGAVVLAGIHRLRSCLRPRQLRHIHRPGRRDGQPVVHPAPRLCHQCAVSGNAIGQLVIVAALASALAAIGWKASFTALAVVNAAILLPIILLVVRPGPTEETTAPTGIESSQPAPQPLTLRQALSSRPYLLLVAIYTICGFQDFFVATHIVAFAQDQGVGDVLAGNLLAWMGVMGLLGVLVAGVMADAFGASRPTALCFVMRIGIFALILLFQGTPAILAFGLLYGFTFLITAPLTVVFLSNIYGPNRLGTLTGTVSMIHQIMGGLGALVGGWVYDMTGAYDAAFVLMLALSLAATVFTFAVREPLRHRTPLGAAVC